MSTLPTRVFEPPSPNSPLRFLFLSLAGADSWLAFSPTRAPFLLRHPTFSILSPFSPPLPLSSSSNRLSSSIDRSIALGPTRIPTRTRSSLSLFLPRKREREERNFDFRLALFLLFPRFPFSPFPSSLPPPVFPARYGRVIYEHCICSLFV